MLPGFTSAGYRRFYGIVITINFNDHAPPHVHAAYGEARAMVGIASGEILQGRLPPHAVRLLAEWVCEHRLELSEDWELVRSGKSPFRIDPLD
ncbi:MAG: hypothetical protein A3K19_15290 [Lentisphaerae bacterium RIFOXYB12_FULL_65_16]|nr:MAG: hypothetical protein A3K18_01785 [Lentisphaerae bacterium RIFOXYA12_64_32]OGV88461.1 MAG: hypothetical protein A3K19_15290 [Lentisphaerae bacterium RIFOXYB12_FULL_65_16]